MTEEDEVELPFLGGYTAAIYSAFPTPLISPNMIFICSPGGRMGRRRDKGSILTPDPVGHRAKEIEAEGQKTTRGTVTRTVSKCLPAGGPRRSTAQIATMKVEPELKGTGCLAGSFCLALFFISFLFWPLFTVTGLLFFYLLLKPSKQICPKCGWEFPIPTNRKRKISDRNRTDPLSLPRSDRTQP